MRSMSPIWVSGVDCGEISVQSRHTRLARREGRLQDDSLLA